MSTAGRHPKFMGSYGLNDKPSDENQPRGETSCCKSHLTTEQSMATPNFDEDLTRIFNCMRYPLVN